MPGSSASCANDVPRNGHQNSSEFENAPDSTSPANTPIGRHSNRRRTSRGRPMVTSITTASITTANSNVYPYARYPNGMSSTSGSNEPTAISR